MGKSVTPSMLKKRRVCIASMSAWCGQGDLPSDRNFAPTSRKDTHVLVKGRGLVDILFEPLVESSVE